MMPVSSSSVMTAVPRKAISPVTLSFYCNRRQRRVEQRRAGKASYPELAHGANADRILNRFQKVFAEIGSEIEIFHRVNLL